MIKHTQEQLDKADKILRQGTRSIYIFYQGEGRQFIIGVDPDGEHHLPVDQTTPFLSGEPYAEYT